MPDVDSTMIPYLSDETLNAVITDVKIALSDLRFCSERRPKDLALANEVVAVTRAQLTAVAERTARLAVDKNVRHQLGNEAAAQRARDAAADRTRESLASPVPESSAEVAP